MRPRIAPQKPHQCRAMMKNKNKITMKTIIYNFLMTLRRFKMASVLNILGLTVAFSAFMVIMMHLSWEQNFNRHIPDFDNLYMLNTRAAFSDGVLSDSPIHARPTVARVVDAHPQITEHAEIFPWLLGLDVKYTIQGTNEAFTTPPLIVSEAYPSIFGLTAVEGSFEDFKKPNSAIIPQSLSKKIFGDTSPVGKTVSRINLMGQVKGEFLPLTVVAVYQDMPTNFSFPNTIIENLGDYHKTVNAANYILVMRTSGISDIQDFTQSIEKSYREGLSEGFSSVVKKLELVDLHQMYATGMRGASLPQKDPASILILLSVAILMLVIATINYTNFFMSLVPVRIKAINIYKVFGAPVGALRANILFEAVGMMLMTFALSLLVVWAIGDSGLPSFTQSSLSLVDNLTIVGMTATLALGIGFVSGAFPALYITRFAPVMVLRGSFGRSRRGQTLRQTLTSFQFIISMVMLIFGWSVLSQLRYMETYDHGYNPQRVIHVAIPPSHKASLLDVLEGMINSSPEFEGMAYTRDNITNITNTNALELNGESFTFQATSVSWNYPELMQMRIVDGRSFTELDLSTITIVDFAPIIINETFARKTGFKVGEEFSNWSGKNRIIGIVSDFIYRSMHQPTGPMMLSLTNPTKFVGTALIRLSPSANESEAREKILKTISTADPTLLADELKMGTFTDLLQGHYSSEQKLGDYIIVFSILTIFISLLGVFGIIIFEMQHRRKEVSVRKVFGASVISILMRFNKQMLWALIISAAVALPLGWYIVNRWLEGFAYRDSVQWWILAVAFVMVVLLVGLLITLQTWRTANANPTKYLKSE